MVGRDRVHRVFFDLLRSGLWSRPMDTVDTLPLSELEWKQVYNMAVAQTVEGIVFDAVERLDQEWLPPTPIWMNWLVRVAKIEQHNKVMNQCLAEQVNYFGRLGIAPFLLKGQGLASCYEAPLRRLCGDIDWYFAKEDEYKRANSWVAAQRVDMLYMPGRSMCYRYKGVDVDHHLNLIDLYSPVARLFLRRMVAREGQQNSYITVEGVRCRVLSPTLNIVQVVSHVLKHLLSFGIGLRQLCDVARVYYTYFKENDGDYLRRIYTQLGIGRWVDLLHDLLVRFLGLESRYLPYESKRNGQADWMMADILCAGNFGFFDERYLGQQGERKDTFLKVSKNLWKYGRYAPMESIFFPLVQVYTRIFKK